jgi:hypothetical protein
VAKAPAKASPREVKFGKPAPRLVHEKRTSQGLKHRPKNKDARRNWKAYRGQGRP